MPRLRASTPEGEAPARLSEAEPGRAAGSVESAIRILRRLGAEGRPMRATELARELGVNTSTCFNILRTLAVDDLVQFDPLSKRYTLSSGILEFTQKGGATERDLLALKPAMERVANERGLLVTLWRRTAKRLVLVLSADPDTPLGIGIPIGCRVPLYLGAAGRVMAAELAPPVAELGESFRRLRWQNPPAFGRYLAEVAEARRRGWALDAGDYIRGVTTVSVPIRGRNGPADHACCGTMFADQQDGAAIESLAASLADIGASL